MTYSDEAVVQGFRGARPDLVRTRPKASRTWPNAPLTTSYRLPALMMPLVADIRRRLPRYSRYVPTAETDRQKTPATFGHQHHPPPTKPSPGAPWTASLLHLGADWRILDPATFTAPHLPECISMRLSAPRTRRPARLASLLRRPASTATAPTARVLSSCATEGRGAHRRVLSASGFLAYLRRPRARA